MPYCFNCCKETNHISQYCDTKPQKIRRCNEFKKPALKDDDHTMFCGSRINHGVLAESDPCHRVIKRLLIRTNASRIRFLKDGEVTNPSINTRYQSKLGGLLTFEWPILNGFSVNGPKTQYYRIPVILGDFVMLVISFSFDQLDVTIVDESVRTIDKVCPQNETLVKLSLAMVAQNVDILYLDEHYKHVSKTISIVKVANRVKIESIKPFDDGNTMVDENGQRVMNAIEGIE